MLNNMIIGLNRFSTDNLHLFSCNKGILKSLACSWMCKEYWRVARFALSRPYWSPQLNLLREDSNDKRQRLRNFTPSLARLLLLTCFHLYIILDYFCCFSIIALVMSPCAIVYLPFQWHWGWYFSWCRPKRPWIPWRWTMDPGRW